jgi:hypothetical protein
MIASSRRSPSIWASSPWPLLAPYPSELTVSDALPEPLAHGVTVRKMPPLVKPDVPPVPKVMTAACSNVESKELSSCIHIELRSNLRQE